jgi:hypothetical protein
MIICISDKYFGYKYEFLNIRLCVSSVLHNVHKLRTEIRHTTRQTNQHNAAL